MKRTSLVILACVFATGVWADTQVDETKQAPADGRVEIDNVAGSVAVRAWDREEIRVEGKLGPDVTGLKFEVHKDWTDIEVVIPKRKRRKIQSDIVLHVPKKSDVMVKAVSASVDVFGLDSRELNLKAVSGDVDVKHCAGAMFLEAVSGDIRLSNADAAVRATSVSGDITIDGAPTAVIARSTSGEIEIEGVRRSVDAETISGDIEVQGTDLERCELTSISGDVDFTGSLGTAGMVNGSTVSGDVELSFQREVSGQFDIATMSGDIDCDFGPKALRIEGEPGRSLRFALGQGTAHVTVETASGDIDIR